MNAPLHQQRELLALLLLAALLVRPRCAVAPAPVAPQPALFVVERGGRLEAGAATDWAGHSTAALVAEGPPFCWAAMDRSLLVALGATPAVAAALIRFRDAGGLPEAGALREQAGISARMAARWAPIFRERCLPRDFAR